MQVHGFGQSQDLTTKPSSTKSVEGAKTSSDSQDSAESSSPPENSGLPNIDVSEKLEALKKEAGKIDVDQIASSSPQIQKVLNDLKALEKVPQNQAKNMCLNICNTL